MYFNRIRWKPLAVIVRGRPGPWIITVVAMLLATSVGCQPNKAVNGKSNSTVHKLTQQDARQAFQQKDFQGSLNLSKQLLKDSPDVVPLLMLAGESATKLQQFTDALDFYGRVPATAGNEAATARWAAGEIHYHLGQPTACIDSLEASLRINPNLIEARERLVWMLGVCGRRRELRPHLMALLQANRTSIETLLDLGNPWTANQNWPELERYRKSTPNDLLPNLVYAKRHQDNGELAQSESLLTALVKEQPELLAAHIQLGNLWLVKDYHQLAAWNAALPTASNLDSDIWYVRGQWLAKLGESKAAIHCLFEAVSLDPNHFLAQAALAQLLHPIGVGSEVTLVKELTERSTKIQQLNQTIDRIGRKNNYEPTIQQAAELTFELGRYWEAIGWSQYGKSLNPSATWHAELLKQILQSGLVNAAMPHTVEKKAPLLDSAWRERFPKPVFPLAEPTNKAVVEANSENPLERDRAFNFTNIASQAGVDFVYRNSTVDRAAGRRMFEFTGGGIGVVDYDNDGRPDLFLAQATPWPIPSLEPRTTAPLPGDVLFRNLESRSDRSLHFRDVTPLARIEERQFGQGVCVADINGDGFDDLYIANVGANQLWINLGDGTFADANSLFPVDRPHYWTVSALAADVDGNGLPEIYDVNYVTGDEVYTLRCDIGGKPRACPPLVFTPAPQQLWIPNDVGSFDAYDWGSHPLACNGLGAVAYRPVGGKLPHIFIAVDQQANVLLNVAKSAEHPHGFAFDDTALLSGIAFDASGQAQACMGIAAGDVDQNGEIDLFVTNFFDEPNTLYMQQGGAFMDETLKTGMAGPSRPMLGFGTQFLDIELDGDLDLVVLNGHIDDHSHVGVAEKMRPQLFQNLGGVRFKEVRSIGTASFFQIPGLGRGLATADMDNDGRLDLLCSDLESPFAILQNHSEPVGAYLAVDLVGVQSDRNAFFSEVVLSKGEFKLSQQLTAGSGYIVSNQRCLHFAIPKDKTTVDIEIRWPSGHVDRIPNVEVNQSIRIIEGQF
jgi:tetratricopeptide (TPR) repeat protein